MSKLSEEYSRDSIDLKATILQYLKYWPYYILCVSIAIIIAKVNLRYSTKIYQSKTNVRILDQFTSNEVDLTGLSNSGGLLYRPVNLNNEIEVIRSRRIMGKVVEELQLETRYYTFGQVRNAELWKDHFPFFVIWNFDDSTEYKGSPVFEVEFSSEKEFRIGKDGKFTDKLEKFNTEITRNGFTFRILPRENVKYIKHAKRKDKFGFQYIPKENLVNQLSRSIGISVLGKTSQILSINIKGPLISKNEAILDMVVQKFNDDGIKDKQRVAEETEKFVNRRLVTLVNELDTIERNLAEYRATQSKTTIELDPTIYSSKSVELETQLFDLEKQISIANGYLDILNNEKKYTVLPQLLGLEDKEVNTQISEYNTLILKREDLLQSASEAHPVVIELSAQLAKLRLNLVSGLESFKLIQANIRDELLRKETITNQALASMPEIERTLREINRQQGIKERLYLFLLEKREAASLSSAVTSPIVKVVDYAFSNKSPVSPNSQFTYLMALFLGLLTPIGWIYVRSFLNTKLHSSSQIRKMIGSKNLPVIGEIPLIDKETPRLIQKHDRSELAEAFRVVRTNLNYIKRRKPEEPGQVIMVTSSTKSEGKTFTSLNTALSFASSGFKVLLVGADLRNPQLHTEMGIDKSNKGLTSFLFDEQVGLEDLLLEDALNQDNLDIIISGFIPPNPAELLMNGRFEQFIEEAKKKYDYIVLDCAPTLLVTDTLLLAPYAELTMYVVRSEVTEIRILEYILELEEADKLPHISLIINGLGKSQKFGYGYGYGYNYGYGYRYGEDVKKTGWAKFVDRITGKRI